MISHEDDTFGVLEWDTKLQTWNGWITISPHGEVGIELPQEYLTTPEVHTHIQKIMRSIERDEPSFREKAANDVFAEGGYVLFIAENQQFDHRQFVNEMHLALIAFETDFPDGGISLAYEYGEGMGMEHGISLELTWEGAYRYARSG
jgi:hypothetical protein